MERIRIGQSALVLLKHCQIRRMRLVVSAEPTQTFPGAQNLDKRDNFHVISRCDIENAPKTLHLIGALLPTTHRLTHI